jgi:hypothetical protein
VIPLATEITRSTGLIEQESPGFPLQLIEESNSSYRKLKHSVQKLIISPLRMRRTVFSQDQRAPAACPAPLSCACKMNLGICSPEAFGTQLSRAIRKLSPSPAPVPASF